VARGSRAVGERTRGQSHGGEGWAVGLATYAARREVPRIARRGRWNCILQQGMQQMQDLLQYSSVTHFGSGWSWSNLSNLAVAVMEELALMQTKIN
jgi:hypothetical protein